MERKIKNAGCFKNARLSLLQAEENMKKQRVLFKKTKWFLEKKILETQGLGRCSRQETEKRDGCGLFVFW